jgi:hypothetical protein
MSQFYIGVTAGALPPTVPTSFAADQSDPAIVPGDIAVSAGSATPQANVLRVAGDHGISTVVSPNVAGVLILRFISGYVTTVGAVTTTAVTQPIPTNTTMTIQILGSGYADENSAVGFWGTAVVKNVAGVVTIINTVDLVFNRDSSGTLNTANATVTASGANLLVNVVGVAGRTIAWGVNLPGIILTQDI